MTVTLPKYFMISDLRFIGIYFLLRRGKIVYIGKTINIISRLSSHELVGCFDSVRVIHCNESELDKYEKRWIIRFRPKYNRQHLFKRIGGWKKGYKFQKINGQIEYEL